MFAIAMTLLILEVHDPGKPHGGLLRGLLDQWPSYASYAVSFLIIGIIWVNHHALFGHVIRVDRPLLYINMLLLLVIAFIPFPTSLLARYLRVGGSDAHTAAVLYSVTMTVMGLTFTALWVWLDRQRELLCPELHPHHVRAMVRRSSRGPVIYALSIGLALLSPTLTLAAYALVAVYFLVPGRKPTTPSE